MFEEEAQVLGDPTRRAVQRSWQIPVCLRAPWSPQPPLSDMKEEPCSLPPLYEWTTCDIDSEEMCTEIYNLLANNYVEDDEDMFIVAMNDMLIAAKKKGYDVFNALDVMQNETFLKELKFGPGDGQLHYYLYNYRIRHGLKPSELGLVLL